MGFTVYLDYAIELSNILILKCKYLFLPIMSLTFQVSTNSLKYDVLYPYIPLSWSWDQRFMKVPFSSSTFSSMEEKLSHTSIFVEFMVFLLGMWNLLMTPLTFYKIKCVTNPIWYFSHHGEFGLLLIVSAVSKLFIESSLSDINSNGGTLLIMYNNNSSH